MKNSIRIFLNICCFLVLLMCKVEGQNPLPALRVYQYDTDNNLIDIDREIENDYGNLTFTNVYFRYYKNPLYNQTFSPIKIMLFRVEYEFLFQINIKDTIENSFKFPVNKNEDRISKVSLVCITQENGKLFSKKLSKKNFETFVNDSSIIIKLNNEALKSNKILRIYCQVESVDVTLKNMSLLNNIPNLKHYISFNVPEIFKYNTESNYLDLVKSKLGDMKLIRFSYDINRLTENYSVATTSFKWKVKEGIVNPSISFPLVSINLPIGIVLGTDANEIINKGE
jgi:hypothetical protein